ncbi:hypothetical protein AK830_g5494 [Neonectria ditissima]|uniref:MADS-box domain-containing protein n=1 Tax=Neonectria ditissima TaxID=78410 RepID=A0A0P7BIY9_9HYPO|nr:hypothetical protein AK830_g5494 [Neonectria ditissima]
MGNPKLTRRRRRTDTLKKKVREYSDIFGVDVAIVLQDRSTLQRQIFTFSDDPDWDIAPNEPAQPMESAALNVGWTAWNEVDRLKERFRRLNLECPP